MAKFSKVNKYFKKNAWVGLINKNLIWKKSSYGCLKRSILVSFEIILAILKTILFLKKK